LVAIPILAGYHMFLFRPELLAGITAEPGTTVLSRPKKDLELDIPGSCQAG